MFRKLKRTLCGLCLPGILLFLMPGQGAIAAVHHPLERNIDAVVLAKSAMLIDGRTGEVLYARNINAHLPPASTIKLLTALLVYETKGFGGNLVVAPEDRAEPSNVPLIPGETVAVHDLMYSLLLGSDNDSALALARYTGGNVQNFVNMMNNRAAALGCRNSHFVNPNGLPAPGQYTCAEDLMKIFTAFVNVPALRSIASNKTFLLKTAARTQTLKNHNKLLGVYAGMGPAKTGWTYASRHTYAAAVSRNGHELYLTILDSSNKWNDACALFDYGFAHLGTPPEPVPASAISPSDLTPEEPGTPVTPPVTTPASAPNAAPNPKTQAHLVRHGETLASIAHRYSCSTAELIHFNHIANPRSLHPGQRILIPARS